jgi:drug/metabolite transporter (DMT)-like permease
MPLFLLTALTMLAFAANSVLTRVALVDGGIDAASFGVIRLLSGAVALAVLCLVTRGHLRLGGVGRVTGVLALLVYMYGFTAAYKSLDSGLGALILFGMVQITMFAGAVMTQEAISPRRWVGAGLAMAGLAWLLWPVGAAQVSLLHGGLMAVAGIAWGIYSLSGRGAVDALQSTAANFVWAAPVGALALIVPATQGALAADTSGIALAVVAGAVTSGMGYALWYTVLPQLMASSAAVAQLTVPVIAMAGGMALLGEALTLRFTLASVLVLGGVAIAVVPRVRRRRQS